MSEKDDREKRRVSKNGAKLKLWICDKPHCGASNLRHVPADQLIFDDTCDYCGLKIHEPITEEVRED